MVERNSSVQGVREFPAQLTAQTGRRLCCMPRDWRMWVVSLALMGAFSGAPFSAYADDIVGYAIVQEDASLRVKGYIIRLFGVYIPPTGRTCLFFLRPTFCASRAALALATKIQGFVRCQLISPNEDGSINAICWVNYSPFDEGEDLAAYLLNQGWAVALPDAPFEYHVLERIARHRGFGVWGLPADRILRPGDR